jgi:uncharacterized membrane protein YbhN (UPF0104 family)
MAHSSAFEAGARRRPVAIAAALAGAAVVWLWSAREQREAVAGGLVHLPWLTMACFLLLILVTVVHFACAGAALRGVSGRQLPWRQTALVQLSAAASNRVVPTGIGGAIVNARYLLRSGLTAGAATSALGALAAVGAMTDAAYVLAVTTVAPAVGLRGASAELRSLLARGTATGQRHGWLVVGVVALGVTFGVAKLRRKLVSSTSSAVRHGVTHVVALGRRPGVIAGTAAASMATTAVLSAGFVAAVRIWAHSGTPLSAGALVALYWVATAAGNATPLPALFGVTEAALVGGLVVAGYTATSATVAVVTFRVVTYWLALPVGLWATRRLRRVSAL